MTVYSQKQYLVFRDEVQNDPLTSGFAAMLSAIPSYVEELSQDEYNALPDQSMRDAYDASRLAWRSAIDTQWPAFETAFLASRNAPDLTTLSAGDIFDVIEMSEFNSLDAAGKQRIQVILGLGSDIKIGPGSKARDWLLDAFPPASTTGGALVAMVTGLSQTRAEELGLGPVYIGAFERIARGM